MPTPDWGFCLSDYKVGEELKLKTLGVLGRRAHEGLHVVCVKVALPNVDNKQKTVN